MLYLGSGKPYAGQKVNADTKTAGDGGVMKQDGTVADVSRNVARSAWSFCLVRVAWD